MNFKIGDLVKCTCSAKYCPGGGKIVEIIGHRVYLGNDRQTAIYTRNWIPMHYVRPLTKLDKALK